MHPSLHIERDIKVGSFRPTTKLWISTSFPTYAIFGGVEQNFVNAQISCVVWNVEDFSKELYLNI